jgi:hypothetical protein
VGQWKCLGGLYARGAGGGMFNLSLGVGMRFYSISKECGSG